MGKIWVSNYQKMSKKILIEEIGEIRKIVKQNKQRNKSIGFVPTMGFLHQGHISLIRAARAENQIVIVSIFVNPAQFSPDEDFEEYPRNLERDISICKDEKVDLIFNPKSEEIYPKEFETKVSVSELKKPLCGISRPNFFDGITIVVAKLFNIIEPNNVYFGQKDAQQALIVKRMIEDLNFPTRMHILPIVRERDGLAMSSRNKYLSDNERKSALSLYKSLQMAKKMIENGEKNSNIIKSKIRKFIKNMPFTKIDYIEIVDYEKLQSVQEIRSNTLVALAVWIGKTRLIDNVLV